MQDLRLRLGSAPRLSEAVYEALFDAMVQGSLLPGAILSEVALAQQLQVSRTPVHDALRNLVHDGMVEQQPQRRAVVRALSVREVEDIFTMRMILEGAAVERAATRIARPSLDALLATCQSLDNAADAGWIEAWAEHDQAFHEAIAQASDSRRLAEDIARYHRLHRGLNRSAPLQALRRAPQEHVAILQALAVRDGAAARTAMLAHIREWQTFFMYALSQSGANAATTP